MSQAFEKTHVPEGLKPGEPVWQLAELFSSQGNWSEQEYFELENERRMEFTNGFIELLPMATVLHQRILAFLFTILQVFASARNLGEVLPSGVRVQLWEGVFREPDVVFMLTENASRIAENYWVGADLVMEVVSDSPSDRRRDLVQKPAEYAQAGIPEYWIVDRELERITVLVLEGSTYTVHGEFGRGEVATSRLLAGFSVDVAKALEGGRAV